MTEPISISIAHSPDTDDELMFWALKRQLIDCSEFSFSFTALETAALNHAAQHENFDVIAISTAVLPSISERYLVLPHGASVGRGYGPVIVTRERCSLADLNDRRIGIPGASTTAALIAQKLCPRASWIEIPIVPYGAIFRALHDREIDAAVLIHEGQLEYKKHGLALVVDLGLWWEQQSGLPLPLGLNVIRRGLGLELIKKISSVMRSSIEFGLTNLEAILPELCQLNISRNTDSTTPDSIKNYLSRYVNSDTLELSLDARQGLALLLSAEDSAPYRIEYAP